MVTNEVTSPIMAAAPVIIPFKTVTIFSLTSGVTSGVSPSANATSQKIKKIEKNMLIKNSTFL